MAVVGKGICGLGRWWGIGGYCTCPCKPARGGHGCPPDTTQDSATSPQRGPRAANRESRRSSSPRKHRQSPLAARGGAVGGAIGPGGALGGENGRFSGIGSSKIAQIGAGALAVGQRLVVPQGINNSYHNAGTFTPYDPARALGDVAPPSAMPPKGKGCGIVGQIFLAAIAIGLSVWLGPIAAGFFQTTLGLGAVGGAIFGGAVVGAGSSIVSQGVGLATGIQDKFNWKSVGLAAIGGAVSGGISGLAEASGTFGKIGSFLNQSNFGSGLVRGTVSSAISQGIGVATGLQDSFSWAGVAAAGIAGGIGAELGRGLAPLQGDGVNIGNIASHTAVGAASLIASAATRSAIEGSSFGRNVMAELPDVIGQVLGRALVGAATARAREIQSGRVALAGLETAEAQRLASLGGGDPTQITPIDPRTISRERAEAFVDDLAATQDQVRSTSDIAGFEARELVQEVFARHAVSPEQRAIIDDLFDPPAVDLDPSMAQAAEFIGFLEVRPQQINPVFHKFVDDVLIDAGQLMRNVGDYIEGNPWLETGLTIIDYTLKALKGPVGFAVSVLVDRVVGAGANLAVGMIADEAQSSGYSENDSQLLGMGAVGAGFLIASGVAAAIGVVRIANNYFGRRSAGSDSARGTGANAAKSNVWRLGAGPRGEAIEQALGHNLPGNFPTIDRFQNGIATSIKSIDLDGASYLTGNGLRNTLTRYVDKVAGFNGKSWAGTTIRSSEITGRSLEVVVPHSGTAAQQATLNQIIQYGAKQGVTVKVIPYP
jgi:hypothetical protein